MGAVFGAKSSYVKRASHLWWGALLLVPLGLTACEEDVIPTPGFIAEESRREPGSSFNTHDTLYDAEGNLREGDEVIVGLQMPRGLTLEREEDRKHIYMTGVPIEKLVGYFGPRLFTGAVSRVGDGAVYRGARPVGVDENVVLLDVSILAAGYQTRVEVHELPPIPANPPSPAELQRRWDEMQRLE